MGKQESIETVELIVPSRLGDKEAQGRLVDKIDSQIRKQAASMRVPRDELSDVAQDAKLSVLGKLSTLRTAGAFRGWIREIVKNVVLRIMRGRKRQGRIKALGIHEPAASETDVQRQVLRRQMRDMVDQFPEPRRTIFQQHFDDGRSYREIAQRLGMDEGVVFHQVRKGMAELRRFFHADSSAADGLPS